MGEEGEFWRAVKENARRKQEAYERKISPVLEALIKHPECKEVGNQWRIGGEWDFWWTGTVRNIKTGERISIYKLAQKFLPSKYWKK